MDKDNLNKHYNSYFAAANSYLGFISYFNNVFPAHEFERIFILKGGPGTGKSSFMKSVLGELSTECDKSTAIYCSSDINSLDGVILEKNNRRIAILDGTAPHTTDPILPGAADEIVNLGEFWDEEKLLNHKKEILNINNKKSEAYSFAYKYLKICGYISNVVFSIIDDIFIDIDKQLVDEISKDAVSGSVTKSSLLLSSYSKIGFTRLNTINAIAKRKYYVPGVYGSEYIFMDKLASILSQSGIEFTIFPSSLFNEKIDTIYIPSVNTAIMSGKPVISDTSEIIDSAKFIDQKKLSYYRYRLEYLWHEREVMLWGAADEFKKASDEHFELEKIYTGAMDFDNQNIKLSAIKEKIKKILEIE